MFQRGSVKKLVRHFADSHIGGVCGRKFVVKEESRAASFGDGFFWDIESLLKQCQSRLWSISTADGEIFALKRKYYSPIPPHIINDDQYLTFKLVEAGQRVIYDDKAITIERASKTHLDDFNVKARMVYGGIQTISTFKHILSPWHGWFAIQFHLHKTIRYFMWLFLFVSFFSSFILFKRGGFYSISFFSQVFFYLLALVGYWQSHSGSGFKIAYFPFYYINVNLAAVKGFLFFLKQESQVEIWKKAER
jgi:biofilm PGA synthesis N-glycosyltransferase PgaC